MAKCQDWITRPTIASLRQALDDLQHGGWSPDQQIQIGQVVNAPEIFTISPVEEWLGSADALPDHYRKG